MMDGKRKADVRRLAAGMLLSRTGDQLTLIALLWFVLEVTGSSVAVGLVLLCLGLPPVVTGPLLGRVLDHWSPRRVMIADNLARALLVAAVPVLHWLGWLRLPILAALALANGALTPATDVGVRVVLPRLVGPADLEPANALLSSGDQVSALVGPALAGILVAHFGGPPVLLLDALSFLLMAALVAPLPDRAAVAPAAAAAAAPGPGLRILLSDRVVRALFGLALVYFFAYGPLEAALPLYSRDVLRAGAGGFGLLWAAFGAGALVGLLSVPAVRRIRPGLALPANALLWGLTLLPLVFVSSLAPAMLALAAGGIVWAPYITIETSLLQRVVPGPLLGWVFGARRAVAAAATPLGAAAGGLLLRTASPATVIGGSALACMLAGILALCSPALRRLPVASGERER
jgi:predicted MFS family arabinose efflux permease